MHLLPQMAERQNLGRYATTSAEISGNLLEVHLFRDGAHPALVAGHCLRARRRKHSQKATESDGRGPSSERGNTLLASTVVMMPDAATYAPRSTPGKTLLKYLEMGEGSGMG
jgi:hypothetical protein